MDERVYGDTRIAIHRGRLTRKGTAVCPGTYDPVTLGHLDIIKRTSEVFDNVIVAVVNSPSASRRRCSPPRSASGSSRPRSAKSRNVQVKPFDTLVVDFAREHGASAIVKGLRAISDFEYEFEMNQLNRKMAPDIESMYLMSSPQYSLPEL